MDNFQIAMTLDLKEFYASLESIEGVSQETVKELQAMFGKVQSVQIPFDGKKIQQALNDATSAAGPTVQQFNRIGQSAQSLNYIIRDSPFFFQRFDMGIMAVSNNLNPFIDDLIRAKAATGSWRDAAKTLTTGLMGVGGLSIAFSLIVAAVQAVSFVMAKGTDETKKMKDATADLKSEMEKASFATLRHHEIKTRIKLIEAENKLIKEQTDEYKKLKESQVRSQTSGAVVIDKSLLGSAETKAEIEAQKENLRVITDAQNRLGLVKERNNKVAELEAYKLTLRSEKEIEAVNKQIEALNSKYKLETEQKQKSIFTTDAEIRAEISKINVLLAGNITGAERIRLLELRNTKVKELIVITEDLIKAQEKLYRIDQESIKKDKSKGLKGPFTIAPLDDVPKPQAFKETNDELQKMLDLSDMITVSFNRAANAVASAAAAGISLFKQENSLLQIFINNLIRATAEAITLKLITTGLNIIGGLFGFPFFGSTVTGVAGMAGRADTSITNPGSNLIANASLSKNAVSGRSGSYSVNPIIQQVPVIMDSRVKGKDIFLTQRKQASYRRKYYGSSVN